MAGEVVLPQGTEGNWVTWQAQVVRWDVKYSLWAVAVSKLSQVLNSALHGGVASLTG